VPRPSPNAYTRRPPTRPTRPCSVCSKPSPATPAACCGAAGTYALLRPEDSARVLDRHLDEIEAADLDAIVVVNPGCYRQLEQGIKRRKLRTRVVHLAELMALGVNCLVLDEPTNHLDLESREALEAALEAFPGTVLLVSHELSAVADEVDRVIVLKKTVLFDGSPKALMREGVSLGVHREDLPLWLEGLE